MSFQPFQSGCGICRSSTDYASVAQAQTGAGKKKRSTKSKALKKKRTSSTSTKKRTSSTSTKKLRIRKMRKMRGGSKVELDEDFIKQNLGITFETVSGGGTPLPPQWHSGKKLMDSPILPGYDSSASVSAPVEKSPFGGLLSRIFGGKKSTKSVKSKKSSSTKKKSVKKGKKSSSTKKKSSSTKKKGTVKKSVKKGKKSQKKE